MISMFFWNIRGVARAPNLKRLKKLIKMHSIRLVGIFEPKADLRRINDITLKLAIDRKSVV